MCANANERHHPHPTPPPHVYSQNWQQRGAPRGAHTKNKGANTPETNMERENHGSENEN